MPRKQHKNKPRFNNIAKRFWFSSVPKDSWCLGPCRVKKKQSVRQFRKFLTSKFRLEVTVKKKGKTDKWSMFFRSISYTPEKKLPYYLLKRKKKITNNSTKDGKLAKVVTAVCCFNNGKEKK